MEKELDGMYRLGSKFITRGLEDPTNQATGVIPEKKNMRLVACTKRRESI